MTHPVVERVPLVGAEAGQGQSRRLRFPQWTPGPSQYPRAGQNGPAGHEYGQRHPAHPGSGAHVGVLDVFSIHHEPVVALIGVQAGDDSPGVTGTKLVLKVERYLKALSGHLPHGVGGDGGIAPVVGSVGPGGGDGPQQLAVGVGPGLGLQLREKRSDAVGVLRLPSPCVDAVAGVRAAIVESITDLERLRLSVGSGPLFAVMSREKAKLSYRWMPAVIQRWATSRGRLIREEETGEPFRIPCCPDCTAQIVDKDGVPLTAADLNRRKHTCAACGAPLWQADKSGPARYPLADYIKHRMKGFFDLLIGDEVHEFKGRGSAQGIAAGILADVCGKSLSLTGTLLGGYSSTIFHLLYRFSPEIRTEFGRSDEHRWIQRYGFEEVSIGKPDDDAVEDGRNSRPRKFRKVVRERPGLVPSALFHIIGNTVFLRLADVASGLPSYEEQVMLSSMDSEEDATGYSQRSAYNTVYEELRLKLAEALKAGSKRLLATYLQTLLAYPDGCTRGETVFDPRSGDVIVQVPPLSEEKIYPRRRPCWTWWRRSGWRGAGCWSTPPTRGPGTSPSGWTTCSHGTGSAWR